nr:MAG TPA: hypothetical protein [Caudoviricetes sp.]
MQSYHDFLVGSRTGNPLIRRLDKPSTMLRKYV